ncbi:MAG: tol-pal system protein YbgF [Desulfuromonadales bacterium]|nr:tol-pal system protein YbgF [Desulfuromonadales bacterium]
MRIKYLLPLLLLPLFYGCATRSDIQSVRWDIDDLRAKIATTDKNVTTVSDDSKAFAKKYSTETINRVETMLKSAADLQANMDNMQVDIKTLAGRVDDLENAVKKPDADIELVKQDTKQQIQALQDRFLTLQQSNDQLKARIDALEKRAQTPESLFQQGINTMQAGSNAKARDIFAEFLKQYPGSPLTADVHYAIADSWYNDKNMDQAILEYQTVIKNFPKSPKVPSAMLKQATAFNAIGDSKSAKFLLKEIIDKHQKSGEAVKAKEMLSKLK